MFFRYYIVLFIFLLICMTSSLIMLTSLTKGFNFNERPADGGSALVLGGFSYLTRLLAAVFFFPFSMVSVAIQPLS